MEYTITPQYHAKKDCYIYVVRLSERISKDDFTNLSELAKSHKGYYSSFRGVNGFVFKSEDEAENFADDAMAIIDALQTSSIAKQSNAIPTCEEKNTLNPPATGMELHNALRAVIQSEGDTIITETRLVNILDDFKAYSDMPTAKYILRAIIADGYAHKLLSIGKWNNDAINLASRFASTTGFMPDAVEILFKSMAYGLEYLNSNPCSNKNNTKVNKNSKAAGTKTRKKTKEEHFKFKGININGPKEEVADCLQKFGYEFVNETEDAILLYGKFAGIDDCTIFVLASEYTHQTYCVMVVTEASTWWNIKADYDRLKEILIKKYGKPSSSIEYFNDPYDEGDGYELTALSTGNVTYATSFSSKAGNILLGINNEAKLIIYYTDKINGEEHDKAKSIDAESDI